jgi:hypothetical protein
MRSESVRPAGGPGAVASARLGGGQQHQSPDEPQNQSLLTPWARAYARWPLEIMPRRATRDGRLIDLLTGSPRMGLWGAAEVAEFLAEYPRTEALAAICGPASDLLVLDVDQHDGGPDGRASLRQLEERLGPLPCTPFTITPTGRGRHYWFRWPGGAIRSGAIAPGIEVLGDRMAANRPPSRKCGRPYRWSLSRHPNYLARAKLPPTWLALMRPPPPPPRRARDIGIQSNDRYVQVALDEELAKVRTAGPGARNAQLNASAWSLGRLVARGDLGCDEVEDALIRAALAAGLPHREATATARRAISGRLA